MIAGDSSVAKRDVLYVAIVIGIAALFLLPALRPGYTLLPLGIEGGIAPWHKQVTEKAKNLLLSDPFYTFYPRRHFFTNAVRAGIYPLWNPYVFAGHPVLGDTAAQTFYPPNLVAALFVSAARALPLLAWFHLSLTGASMYGFLRSLQVRPGCALYGALAWMLNGSSVVWLENPHRLSTLAWMPVVLLLFEQHLRTGALWNAVLAGGAFGCAILGGHTQFAMGIAWVLAAYALFRAFGLSVRARRLVPGPVVSALVIALLGIGVGSVQLLPSLQLAQLSHRSVMGTDAYLASRWPLRHVVGLWIPDFYGNPVRFPFWGERNYAEVTAYYGACSLPLSLAALFWSRRGAGRFFALATVVTILVALGTPLTWLVAWLPWARLFRLTSLIALVPFFGGAAAALGLDALVQESTVWPRAWRTIVGVLGFLAVGTVLLAVGNQDAIVARWPSIVPYVARTAAIWVVGIVLVALLRHVKHAAAVGMSLVLAVDLLQWGFPFNPVNSVEILYPDNEVTDWLRQDTTQFRVLPLQTDRVIFGPNVLSVLGFSETGGYSSLMVERYRDLVKAIEEEVAIWWMRPNRNMLVNSRFDPLFSLLNVKYVLATDSLDDSIISVDAGHECTGSAMELDVNEIRTAHSFTARRSGLNRMDVPLVGGNEEIRGQIRFRLWRGGQDGALLAEVVEDAAEVQDQGQLVVFFAPVADSAGQEFVWEIEGLEPGRLELCQAKAATRGVPAFQTYGSQLHLADIRQGVWIYENPNVMPRAVIVPEVRVVPESSMLAQLTSPGFNPWRTALLENSLPEKQMTALELEESGSSGYTASVVSYGLHRVEVRTNATRPGLLVLSDAYYPGWKATVDGVPAPVLRVDYALRGVYLPVGARTVEFRFVPVVLAWGAALTAASLLAGFSAVFADLSRMRRGVTTALADSRRRAESA